MENVKIIVDDSTGPEHARSIYVACTSKAGKKTMLLLHKHNETFSSCNRKQASKVQTHIVASVFNAFMHITRHLPLLSDTHTERKLHSMLICFVCILCASCVRH